MVLDTISLDCRVLRDVTGPSRKVLSGSETLKESRSMGMDTLSTDTSPIGMDTGKVVGLLYFFLSAFFLLLSRNLLCPVLYEWLILHEERSMCMHIFRLVKLGLGKSWNYAVTTIHYNRDRSTRQAKGSISRTGLPGVRRPQRSTYSAISVGLIITHSTFPFSPTTTKRVPFNAAKID